MLHAWINRPSLVLPGLSPICTSPLLLRFWFRSIVLNDNVFPGKLLHQLVDGIKRGDARQVLKRVCGRIAPAHAASDVGNPVHAIQPDIASVTRLYLRVLQHSPIQGYPYFFWSCLVTQPERVVFVYYLKQLLIGNCSDNVLDPFLSFIGKLTTRAYRKHKISTHGFFPLFGNKFENSVDGFQRLVAWGSRWKCR